MVRWGFSIEVPLQRHAVAKDGVRYLKELGGDVQWTCLLIKILLSGNNALFPLNHWLIGGCICKAKRHLPL
jgi:hypothetical protein